MGSGTITTAASSSLVDGFVWIECCFPVSPYRRACFRYLASTRPYPSGRSNRVVMFNPGVDMKPVRPAWVERVRVFWPIAEGEPLLVSSEVPGRGGIFNGDRVRTVGLAWADELRCWLRLSSRRRCLYIWVCSVALKNGLGQGVGQGGGQKVEIGQIACCHAFEVRSKVAKRR